jgi:hypothetical protein
MRSIRSVSTAGASMAASAATVDAIRAAARSGIAGTTRTPAPLLTIWKERERELEKRAQAVRGRRRGCPRRQGQARSDAVAATTSEPSAKARREKR